MLTENVELREGYSHVSVMPYAIVGGKVNATAFETYSEKYLGIRFQYLEEIPLDTEVNTVEEVSKEVENASKIVGAKLREESGSDDLKLPEINGRNDVFVAIHNDDYGKFLFACLMGKIKAVPLDYIWTHEHGQKEIYPERVVGYLTKK